MYWDESPVENRGRVVCVCVCVCARAQGCSILDKNSLKRETHSNSVNLLCICILLSCSSLSSSPLITSVNLSLLNPSYNPPPFLFFTLCQASQTLSFPFHTHWFLSFFFIAFHHISGRHLPVSGFVFFLTIRKRWITLPWCLYLSALCVTRF